MAALSVVPFSSPAASRRWNPGLMTQGDSLGGGRLCPRQRTGALGRQRHHLPRLAISASGRRRWFDDSDFGQFGHNEFGPYPWQRGSERWHQDRQSESPPEMVTFLTSEGMVRLPSRSHAWSSSSRRHGQPVDSTRGAQALQTRRGSREEGQYMDPAQQLCLGAVFDIKALNGVSRGRLFCVDGFCRSVQMLSDVIADAVEEEGGEVLVADISSSSGLNERLHLTLVLPFLWGVPPTKDSLRRAIHEGGGIVHRCFQQWEFL